MLDVDKCVQLSSIRKPIELHMPSRVSFQMTLSDREWLSEIYNEYNLRIICKNCAHNPEKRAQFADFLLVIPLSLI